MKRGIVSLVFRCRPMAGEPHPTDEAVTCRSGRYIKPATAKSVPVQSRGPYATANRLSPAAGLPSRKPGSGSLTV
jgi:hypothetical protein